MKEFPRSPVYIGMYQWLYLELKRQESIAEKVHSIIRKQSTLFLMISFFLHFKLLH